MTPSGFPLNVHDECAYAFTVKLIFSSMFSAVTLNVGVSFPPDLFIFIFESVWFLLPSKNATFPFRDFPSRYGLKYESMALFSKWNIPQYHGTLGAFTKTLWKYALPSMGFSSTFPPSFRWFVLIIEYPLFAR